MKNTVSYLFWFYKQVFSFWFVSRTILGTLFQPWCHSLCYSCLVSSCIVLTSVFPHFSLSFVRALICLMHTWISWNTTELGLPFQSDPLVRGSLNIRAICRLVVYLYTSLFCFACSCHYVWRRKDELNVDSWIVLFYWKAY